MTVDRKAISKILSAMCSNQQVNVDSEIYKKFKEVEIDISVIKTSKL